MVPRFSLLAAALLSPVLAGLTSAAAPAHPGTPDVRLVVRDSATPSHVSPSYDLWTLNAPYPDLSPQDRFLAIRGGERHMVQFVDVRAANRPVYVVSDRRSVPGNRKHFDYRPLVQAGGAKLRADNRRVRHVVEDLEAYPSSPEFVTAREDGSRPGAPVILGEGRYRHVGGVRGGRLELTVGGLHLVGTVDQAGLGAAWAGRTLARVQLTGGEDAYPGGATMVLRDHRGGLLGVVTTRAHRTTLARPTATAPVSPAPLVGLLAGKFPSRMVAPGYHEFTNWMPRSRGGEAASRWAPAILAARDWADLEGRGIRPTAGATRSQRVRVELIRHDPPAAAPVTLPESVSQRFGGEIRPTTPLARSCQDDVFGLGCGD